MQKQKRVSCTSPEFQKWWEAQGQGTGVAAAVRESFRLRFEETVSDFAVERRDRGDSWEVEMEDERVRCSPMHGPMVLAPTAAGSEVAPCFG